jgi:hypothetical protein
MRGELIILGGVLCAASVLGVRHESEALQHRTNTILGLGSLATNADTQAYTNDLPIDESANFLGGAVAAVGAFSIVLGLTTTKTSPTTMPEKLVQGEYRRLG